MKEVLSKRAGLDAATQTVRVHGKELQRRDARFETTYKRIHPHPLVKSTTMYHH